MIANSRYSDVILRILTVRAILETTTLYLDSRLTIIPPRLPPIFEKRSSVLELLLTLWSQTIHLALIQLPLSSPDKVGYFSCWSGSRRPSFLSIFHNHFLNIDKQCTAYLTDGSKWQNKVCFAYPTLYPPIPSHRIHFHGRIADRLPIMCPEGIINRPVLKN